MTYFMVINVLRVECINLCFVTLCCRLRFSVFLCTRLTINRIRSRTNMGLIALGFDSKTLGQLIPYCPSPYAITSTNTFGLGNFRIYLCNCPARNLVFNHLSVNYTYTYDDHIRFPTSNKKGCLVVSSFDFFH
jgi:hypothetical protein